MLSGKLAVISGASSGIGAGIARCFAAEKSILVLTGRHQERLREVADDCRKLGASDVQEVVADLKNEDDIRRLVSITTEKYKTVDVLVNNAASSAVCPFTQTTMEDMTRIFQVNVHGPFLLTQLLMPHLVNAKGCVINLSSITSLSVLPNSIAYGMSKAAINHFTEALAFEYAKTGVRINAVSPAAVRTRQMCEDVKLSQIQIDAILAFMEKQQPLGGVMKADDIAKVVLFLASPNASCITGQTIRVEAGYSPYHILPKLM